MVEISPDLTEVIHSDLRRSNRSGANYSPYKETTMIWSQLNHLSLSMESGDSPK